MSVLNRKIGFIGVGNMAEALIKGMLRRKLVAARNIIAADIRASRLALIKRKYRLNSAPSNKELVAKADIIILAVKPKNIKVVLKEITGIVTSRKLVISIAAGVPIKLINKELGKNIPVVRVMPNTPALVGAGISVLSPGRGVSKSNLKLAGSIFSSVGEALVLPEKYLDAVTAVSGSGPAYFFYLIECLIKAGCRLGLKKADAYRLAVETGAGSSRLIKETKLDPTELRQRVTSKGGTTEAAFKVFSRRKLSKIIEAGVKAAAKKSKEITKKLCS